MVTDLKLKGNTLILYAIIYGFSQTTNTAFTGSVDYMCEWLGGVSRNTVFSALKGLEKCGLITKTSETKGFITYNTYKAVDVDDLITSSKTELDTSSKTEPNNIVTNNIVTNNIDNVEQSSTIPYSEIINYLNEKAGTSFRSNSKDNQKHISARWNDGYRIEDFFSVIDIKVSEWKTDKKMYPYLRPSTLFGTKFESYLQQAVKCKDSKSLKKFNDGAMSKPVEGDTLERF